MAQKGSDAKSAPDYEQRVGPAPPNRDRRDDEPLLEWVRRVDPEVIAAVADVDRTLLREALALSPLERLRACSRAAHGLARFRRVAS